MRDRVIRRLRVLLPDADPAQLEVCADMAAEDFAAICGRDDVPETAVGVVSQMAEIRYTRIGAAGLSAQSFSGASETFAADYPESLKRAMYRHRRLRSK